MQKFLESIIHLITSRFEVDAVYLYGSRARGTARPDSDWDLAVLFSTYERDLLERVLRPQHVEALLERSLRMYGQLSVVDLEIVPPPLQMNIIRGKRIFDRGVPHVRRVEYSVISRIEKDYEHA
jgi:predicted nucleotidyltransferase